MKTISTSARLISLAMAFVTTFVVIGSTVVGMERSAETQPLIVAMDKVPLKATAVQ